MRLLECYIENFGKIKQQRFDFSQNFNIIYQENGWGKSTLATFIKVMFFGFDGERKQGLANERKRYAPWQGGAYGGELCFSVREKSYRLHRIFGANAGKDVFELKDMVSNLPSKDYSANLGEEIFGLDRDSFQRTVFIAQEQRYSADVTGKIHAKLGDLAENTQDMAGYERALQKLSAGMTELNGRSANAKCNRLKKEITELEMQIREVISIEQKRKELEESSLQNKVRQEEVKTKRDRVVKEKQEILTKLAENKGAIEIAELSEEENVRLEQLKIKFRSGLPTKEEIKVALADCEEIKRLKVEVMHSRISDTDQIKINQYEKLFKNGIPSNIELEEIIYAWNKKEEKRAERRERKKVLEEMEARGKSLIKENKKDLGIFLLIVLILFLAVLIISKSYLAGSLFVLVSAILWVSFYIYRHQQRCIPIYQEIAAQQQEIDRLKKRIQSLESEIVGFFQRYDLVHQLEFLPDILFEWKKARKEYVELKEKRERVENSNLAERLQAKQRYLEELLGRYGFAAVSDIKVAEREVMQLLEDGNEYIRLLEKEKQEKKKRSDLNQWLVDNLKQNVDEISYGNYSSLFMPMDNKIKRYTDTLEELEKQYATNRREMSRLEEKQDEISEKEIRLSQLREEYNNAFEEFTLLEKTKIFLEMAKSSFSQKYSNPILQSFQKYYQRLTGQEANHYVLDADIHLHIKEHGLQRNVEALSAGYQDLIGVCMRMALVDAMYTEEKPFLVFDDPFVNLDEEKIERGLEFLKESSQCYQMIYFTCHSGRK